MIINFTIPGPPVGKARARTVTNHGKTHSFTPDRTVLYENLVKLCFQEKRPNGWQPHEGPVELHVSAYFQIPKSTSKKDRERMLTGEIRPTKKPDGSNIEKVIEDALNGIAYIDDSQIVDEHAHKLYSETPEVRVMMEFR